MSTYTAQILVGRPHQNHGGIEPQGITQIFLSENDRPCWVAAELGGQTAAPGKRHRQLRWIPESPRTILEDGLLYVALHVMRNEGILAKAPTEMTSFNSPLIDLTKVDGIRLSHLRAECRNYDFGGKGDHKLVISVTSDSTVLQQLSDIDDYRFECEILTPSFARSYSAWTGSTTKTGSLK